MMKQITLTILAVLCATFVNAQNIEPEFDKHEHDFGDVEEGPVYRTAFVVTNNTNQDIKFINASASCGCTVAEYPKQAIKPGESDSIIVTFNSHNRFGNFYKKVSVWDATGKEYHLAIKGYVIPERALLELDSNNVDLGNIQAGQVITRELEFENRGGEKLDVIGATSDCGNVTVKTTTSPLDFGERGKLTFTIDTRGREGVFDCTISIKSNSYVYKTMYLRANVVAGPAVMFISKSVYDLGVLSPSDARSTTVEIKNTGGQNLDLTDLVTDCKNVKAKFTKTTLAPGETGQIQVTFDFVGRKKEVNCEIVVKSNGGNKTVVLKAKASQDK